MISKKSILTRTASGAIYIILILLAFLIGKIGITILAVLFGIRAMVETERMILGNNDFYLPAIIVDIVCLISIILFPVYHLLTILILPAGLLSRFIISIYQNQGKTFLRLGASIFSIAYIGLGLMAMVGLEILSPPTLLFLFIFVWINDTGAYLVGCTFGKHRLFERISPKKSWEGFFGGLALTIIFAICFSAYATHHPDTCASWPNNQNMIQWACFAGLTTVWATFGDLFESLLKRSMQVKDSGHIIPGHGGLLDRIDSLLFVFPGMYIYLLLISLI